MTAYAVSVVLPSRNEPGIGSLLREIAEVATLFRRPLEVVVVDDSDPQAGINQTELAVRKAMDELHSSNLTIRWFHRPPGERPGRLSGAMLFGLQMASSDVVVYADSDGQHPPEIIPKLIAAIEEDGADVVVGSRYCRGGSSEGLDNLMRHVVSRSATALVRALWPWALRGVTDPMSGCFAVRKDAVDIESMTPRGFKFLFELLARHPRLKRAQVPLQFRERTDGESKAGEGNGADFLRQVPSLRAATLPEVISFGLIGLLTAVFGAMLLWLFVHLGMNPLVANALQLLITMSMNYWVYQRYVWPQANTAQPWPAFWFFATRTTTALASWYIFVIMLRGGYHYQVANVGGLLVGFVLNYATSKLIFDSAARTTLSARFRAAVPSLQLLILGALGVYVLHALHLSALASVMLVIALFNTGVGALEARWRTYAWRTPEAAQQMGWPDPADPANSQMRFSIIVPARHEEENIGATLRKLLESTHPNYQIIVALCSDDRPTIQAVEDVLWGVPAAMGRIQVVIRDYLRPTKPQQLNAALEYLQLQAEQHPVSGPYFVGVIDAEDVTHPELLLRVEALATQSEADIVQGGVQLMNLGSRPSHWFQAHNVMEYFAWFSSRMAYQAQAGFVPLGGNTVFIRFDLLIKAGGWPLSLTEDCALGVKLSTLYGAKVATAYDPEFATREEAPPTVFDKQAGSLFFQRVRWNQGFLGELLAGQWLKMPTLRQRFLAGYILATPFLQALSALLIPVALVTAFTLKLPVALTMLMFAPFIPIGLSITTQLMGLHDFGRQYQQRVSPWHYATLLFMAWPYQMLLGACAVYAAVRHFKGNDTWYKTGRAGVHQSATLEGATA